MNITSATTTATPELFHFCAHCGRLFSYVEEVCDRCTETSLRPAYGTRADAEEVEMAYLEQHLCMECGGAGHIGGVRCRLCRGCGTFTGRM